MLLIQLLPDNLLKLLLGSYGMFQILPLRCISNTPHSRDNSFFKEKIRMAGEASWRLEDGSELNPVTSKH